MKLKIGKKNIYENLIFLCIFIFSIGRIVRNSFFHDSIAQGGIWNYISVVFLFLFFIIIRNEIFSIGKIKKLHFLFLVYVFYSVLIDFKNNGVKDIISVYNFLMYPFFIYIFLVVESIKGKLEKKVFFYAVFFYIVTLINLFSFILYSLGKIRMIMVSNVYYSLCLFPFVLLNNRRYKSKVVKMLPILLLIVTLIFSYKRTGFFGFVIAYFMYYIIKMKGNLARKLFRTLIILMVIITSIILLKNKLPYKYARRFDIAQMKKDKGSGRLEIYELLLKDFYVSDLDKKIFGIERRRIGKLTSHYNAHNDFIEILYTHGIIGFILFIMIYLYFIKEFYLMYQKRYEYLPEYSFMLVINIFLSLLSVYFIDYSYSILGASCTSYLIKDFKNKQIRRNYVRNKLSLGIRDKIKR